MKFFSLKKIILITLLAAVTFSVTLSIGVIVSCAADKALDHDYYVTMVLGGTESLDLTGSVSSDRLGNDIVEFEDVNDGVVTLKGNTVTAIGVGEGEIKAKLAKYGTEVTVHYEVSFKDQVIKNVLGSYLTQSTLQSIESLNLDNAVITDVSDLYYLTSLKDLSVVGCGLSVGYSQSDLGKTVINVYNLPQLRTVKCKEVSSINLKLNDEMSIISAGFSENLADYYRGDANLTYETSDSGYISLNGGNVKAVGIGTGRINVYSNGQLCETVEVVTDFNDSVVGTAIKNVLGTSIHKDSFESVAELNLDGKTITNVKDIYALVNLVEISLIGSNVEVVYNQTAAPSSGTQLNIYLLPKLKIITRRQTESLSLKLGGTVDVSEFINSADYLRGTAAVTFTSSNTGYLSVNKSVVTAVGVGTGQIRLSVNGEVLNTVTITTDFNSSVVGNLIKTSTNKQTFTQTELKNVNELVISNSTLTDFSDIYYLTGLKYLTLSNCGLKSIVYTSGVTSSSNFNLYNFSSLMSINLSKNTSLQDVSALSSLPNLSIVDISSTGVTDYTIFAGLASLNITGTKVIVRNDSNDNCKITSDGVSAETFGSPYYYCYVADDATLATYMAKTLAKSDYNRIIDFGSTAYSGDKLVFNNAKATLLGNSVTLSGGISMSKSISLFELDIKVKTFVSNASIDFSLATYGFITAYGSVNVRSNSPLKAALIGKIFSMTLGNGATFAVYGCDGNESSKDGGIAIESASLSIYSVSGITTTPVLSVYGGKGASGGNGGTAIVYQTTYSVTDDVKSVLTGGAAGNGGVAGKDSVCLDEENADEDLEDGEEAA